MLFQTVIDGGPAANGFLAPVAELASPITLFEPEFARRALLATLCAVLIGAALGWIVVLRDLPFFVHSVGAGAYPAMVLGAGLGVSAVVAAQFGALAFAGCLWLLTLGRGADPRVRDARTGLLVAAAMAGGAALAAVFARNQGVRVPGPETMLFGSVLATGGDVLVYATVIALSCAVATMLLGGRWLAAGFDREAADGLGLGRSDASLLALSALAVAAMLPLTGALMAGALLVIPAATARLYCNRPASLAAATGGAALFAGLTGLYLALAFDLPAGAAIAVVAGGGFVIGHLLVMWRADGGGRRRAASPRAAVVLILLTATPLLAGCGDGAGPGATGDEPKPVVATTTQAADIVRRIGGSAVTVTALLKPGASPHEFEPRPSDVTALAQARVIFRQGGDVDAWLAPAIEAVDGRDPVDLSNAAVLLPANAESGDTTNDGPPDDGTPFNAHWPLDPANLQAAALLVRDELIKAVPERREIFRANAARFAAQVRAADAALERCAAHVPDARRVIAVDHDEFDYLAERYKLTIGARLRGSGEREPSVRELQRAVAAARRAGARAVVTGSGDGGKLAATVADRLGVPLLKLYSDSLSPAGGPADGVLNAVIHDLSSIIETVSGGDVRCAVPRR